MAFHPRSGLFGFLLLLGALVPSAGMAASRTSPAADPSQQPQAAPAFDSIEARLSRISAALREQAPPLTEEAAAAADKSAGDKLAWAFFNGPGVGFRNGFGNGGFRNGGGWGNGFRNGGFGNGGFRNGGFWNHW